METKENQSSVQHEIEHKEQGTKTVNARKQMKFNEVVSMMTKLSRRAVNFVKRTEPPCTSYNEFATRKASEMEKTILDIKSCYSHEALRPNRDKKEELLNDLSQLILDALVLGGHMNAKAMSEMLMHKVRCKERLADNYYLYYANVAEIGKKWLINFPDLPECLIESSTREGGIEDAHKVLRETISTYKRNGEKLPYPSSYRVANRNKKDWRSLEGIKVEVKPYMDPKEGTKEAAGIDNRIPYQPEQKSA